ncbi:4'-phosphopantetheinyl transferase superfamily protein [Kitasatospora sp. SUK 42]|nr:4'-phosphopantetheinyl transferase superfamily protein [Kitasatospora sp. SUK 42]
MGTGDPISAEVPYGTGQSVLVWRIPLSGPIQPGTEEAPFLAELEKLLDADERARARSGRLPGVRRRFVVSHAATRILLGERLGRPPDGLRFVRGRWGKPAVADAPGLHFSLSHSGELALLALAPRPVGVDLELVRSGRDVHRLSRRFFPCQEEELVARGGRSAFARLWARKEACVKASGGRLTEGLALPVAHPAAEATVHAPDSGPLTGPWRVADLPLPEEYAGSVALLGDGPFSVSGGVWYPIAPGDSDPTPHKPGVK